MANDPPAPARYRIEGLIGQGGMAAVYSASPVEGAGRFAIKILLMPTAAIQARLLHEGRFQSSIVHENIVRVVDVVEAGGSPGLVMELVPGPSLDQLFAQIPLDTAQIDDLARGVLRGVAAAHAQGLIHRDIKPANVLLFPEPHRIVPKIADFGLARLFADETDTRLTRTGAVMGTPAYMAPEQLRDASRVDTRADVWSLGVLLYELCTGERLFTAQSLVDIFRRIEEEGWPRLQEVAPHLPPRMWEAVDRAMSPNPDDRPSDAAALLSLWEAGTPAPDQPWEEELCALIGSLGPTPRARVGDTTPPELYGLSEVTSMAQVAVSRPGAVPRRSTPRLLGALAVLGLGALLLWRATEPAHHAYLTAVHRLPGAPGRPAGDSLYSLTTTEELGQIGLARCLSLGETCAREEPTQLDRWVSLLPGAPSSWEAEDWALSTELAPGERLEVGGAGPWAPLLAKVEGHIPTATLLRRPEASEPLILGPEATVPLRWTPGDGPPFLELRPRQEPNLGRLYRLADDGSFDLDLSELGLIPPAQIDLVFGHRAQAGAAGLRRSVLVETRTEQWLTLLLPEPDRIRIQAPSCGAAMDLPPLDPGRYWGLLDGASNSMQPGPDGCVDAAAGVDGVVPARVPAGGRLAAVLGRMEGDAVLYMRRDSCSQPCWGGVDKQEGNGPERLTWRNEGAEEAKIYLTLDAREAVGDGHQEPGGMFSLDLVLLSPPESQRLSASWTGDSQEGRFDLWISNPSDTAFRLGIAESAAGELGWTGEDCLDGDGCHAWSGPRLSLTHVPRIESVRAGETTLFAPVHGRGDKLTYLLEAINEGSCWTWGHDPTWYAARHCTVVDGVMADEAP